MAQHTVLILTNQCKSVIIKYEQSYLRKNHSLHKSTMLTVVLTYRLQKTVIFNDWTQSINKFNNTVLPLLCHLDDMS